MAKDGKTEKATPYKKKKAREDGSVPKSKELGIFFNVVSFTILLVYFGDWFGKNIVDLMRYGFQLIINDVGMGFFVREMGQKSGMFMLYVSGIGFIFMTANYFIQTGILISWKIIKFDLKKINPKKYFGNLFKRKTFVDIVKSFLIVCILGYVVYFVFKQDITKISSAMLLPWQESLYLLWEVLKNVLIKVVIALMIIGMIDFVYQRWEHEEQLKMKKHEVKDERKNQEGSAEVKGKQREKMLEILKNEVKQKVPESTFVVTNPTHYSIAIKYKAGEGNPKVTVKGVDHLALFIREIAEENEIPMVENAPLARELYQRVLENEDIPQDLWEVVAKILHQLLSLRKIKID